MTKLVTHALVNFLIIFEQKKKENSLSKNLFPLFTQIFLFQSLTKVTVIFVVFFFLGQYTVFVFLFSTIKFWAHTYFYKVNNTVGRESLKLNELEIKRLIKRCVCVFDFRVLEKLNFSKKKNYKFIFHVREKKKERMSGTIRALLFAY